MIQLKVSSNGAIYPNRGINVGMKYDNTNEQILFVLPEALETYNKYVVYSNNRGTFLAPLLNNIWTIRSNITNYPGTVKCLFLLSETELDPNNFEINNVATFLKVSGEFQINVANHFLKPESVQPEEESPEIQLLFNNMMTLYKFFEDAKENDYYRGTPGPSGTPGPRGTPGPQTITVGTTTAGLPTENAAITNVGTQEDMILNFRIPRGVPGVTPIKGIDYNTHEDGHFLLKDQGLGAHLEYKVDGVTFNNGIFPNREAIIDAYNAMYAETEEEVGLYNHLYLANQFGPSADPLETVVLEGITWYNTYTWNASTYLGGAADAIQIGSNNNPIRYFEHQSANNFTNVTKIQIKLSRDAVATDATYSIYIGDTPIAENVSIPETRTDFTVYTFDAISGPLTITFNHTQSGALYLGTVQIFATEIYEFDRAQWHWAQLQTDEDEYKYSIWVSTDKNNDIQFASINEWGESLALGETSSTAYRGDRGKTAYDHSQIVSGNPHNITKAMIDLGNVDNISDLDKPISTATQDALDNLVAATDIVLSSKADKTYVDSQDALKVNKTTTVNGKELSTDIEIGIGDIAGLETTINTKANKTYVDTQDELKANKTYVDAQDELKADKTYVDVGLSLKENITDNNQKLTLKADKSYVDNKLSLKVDKTTTVNGKALSSDILLDASDIQFGQSTVEAELDHMLDTKADQATTLAGYGITDAYTKAEVDNRTTAVYRVKGNVSTYASLPSTGQITGDVYNVVDTGINYVWNGTEWDDIGGVESMATASEDGLMSKEDFVKLQALYTRSDLDNKLALKADKTYVDSQDALKVDKTTTVNGKDLSSDIVLAVDDIEGLAELLDGIETLLEGI